MRLSPIIFAAILVTFLLSASTLAASVWVSEDGVRYEFHRDGVVRRLVKLWQQNGIGRWKWQARNSRLAFYLEGERHSYTVHIDGGEARVYRRDRRPALVMNWNYVGMTGPHYYKDEGGWFSPIMAVPLPFSED